MSKNTGTSELINYFDLGANGDVGIAGSLDINTIANATTDTDTFLVSDTGIIKYRTGAQLLSDIGAAPAVAGGYVPYTGATTNVDLGVYNLTASAIIANGSGSNSGIVHLESNAIHSLVNGYGSIASGTTNQFNLYQTTGAGVFRGAILSLNSITEFATRTFTLPDADGTIALTSSLSGYLPLAGGTLTGALNGTTASFSGTITSTITNALVLSNNVSTTQYVYTSLANSVGNARYGVDNSSGGGLGTGTSANSAVFGNAGNADVDITTNNISRLKIASTGEATFSSSAQTSSFFRSNTPTTNSITIGVSANSNYNYIGNSNFWGIRTGTSADFNIDLNNSGSPINALRIASTGAATFSSSVTSQVNNISADGAGVVLQGYVDNILRIAVRGSGYNSGARGGLLASTGDFSGNVTSLGNFGSNAANTSTAPQYFLTQAGGNTYSAIGINRADGTGIAAGIGSALVLRSGDATEFPIHFATANNVRLTIATGGNVLIGTTTDTGQRLQVNGITYSTNYISGTQGLNVSGYGFLTQTISGQMTVLGHNISASSSVANQVNVVNGGWYSSMIRMYYSEGITFHTSTTVYSAGAVYPMDTTTERVRIQTDGQVRFQSSIILTNGQINSLTSGGSGQSMYLNFGGNGAIYAGSSYTVLYAGSDERIKTEINHSQSTLTKILNLIPRTFKYKERPEVTNYGFIAQEVEAVMPELVRTSEGITMCLDEQIENQKSVESYGLAWASILVKAIQEQQQQIQELKNKLS